MRKKLLNKKKGFTLVELIAVVTILGVISIVSIAGVSRLIHDARNNEIKQQKKIVVLATESFLQYNKGRAPKKAGDANAVTITFMDLKNNNFLKEDIKGPDGANCMASSYIKVTKKQDNKNIYKYDVTLNCGGQVIGMRDIPTPSITANLVGNKDSLIDLAVLMNFYGGKDKSGKTSKIDTYSYTFYSKDYDEGNYKKVYDSGFLKELSKEKIKTIKTQISNYVNINNVEHIMLKLQVRNKEGGIGELNSIIL